MRIIQEVVPSFPDRVMPLDNAAAAVLRSRTLTNLYNERPTWLVNAHRELDEAVALAYGWPADISDEDALGRLLDLNRARAQRGASAQRERRPTPEELRREPEFAPMPIPGGRVIPQKPLPLDEPLLSSPPPAIRRRRTRR